MLQLNEYETVPFFLQFGIIWSNVWFMSYSKCWNCRQTWNLCFLLNFQLSRNQIEKNTLIELWSFISFELRHLNSMKVSQKAKFSRSIFHLEIKKQTDIPSSMTISTLRIWHEPDINQYFWFKYFDGMKLTSQSCTIASRHIFKWVFKRGHIIEWSLSNEPYRKL